MAAISSIEQLISETTLDQVIISDLAFNPEKITELVGKGNISISSKPGLGVSEDGNKLVLDLELIVDGTAQSENGDIPVFNLNLLIQGIFIASEKIELAGIQDISDEPVYLMQTLCRQIYPVARVKIQEVLDGSAFRGVLIPWQINFVPKDLG